MILIEYRCNFCKQLITVDRTLDADAEIDQYTGVGLSFSGCGGLCVHTLVSAKHHLCMYCLNAIRNVTIP